MSPTLDLPTASKQSVSQQRILRLPDVQTKTGFGRSTMQCPSGDGQHFNFDCGNWT